MIIYIVDIMLAISYLDLKQQIAYKVAANDRHGENLRSLKEFFRDDINSPRRYEKINTIGELLRILETRDILSEDDIQPLKEIALRMPNSGELLGTIGRYEWSHRQKDVPNYYVPENILGVGKFLPSEKPQASFNNGMSSLKKHRIYETVIEQIGTYWCILGRKLKIRECVIDEINRNNTDLYSKAAKLMELYEQKADPQNWFFTLCEALDNAKRDELRKTIQNIMMMNI